ncbi:MAG: ATP-binding protein [Planctomycetota bacterium]
MPTEFEQLGVFYLGRRVDPASGEVLDEPLLYDSKDLTTHAVCVGMTGSGKTGLCLALIEEAAIDGIPVIAIDPKGDLGNLALTFPELRPSDFAPWIDPGEALRKGRTVEQYAADVATSWKKGLTEWGQDGARIARFRDAVDLAIYTPGSNAGLQISALRSFNAPPAELQDDTESWSERIVSAVSGLLALLGIDADPVRSREHVLLSNIVDHVWRDGRDLDLAELIRAVQSPPFARIGVLDVDSFFPAADRAQLAMAINALIASPGFATWLEGEPLDVQRLLWTADGRPRVSILSIGHLSEPQRMFFVTLLLGEIVAWTRAQAGTSSLRAVVYMDEVFGYLPPTANPPSKRPLLTLLKQARAFGVGCVLATQNPVDLDYKALSNAGTWFLGRLQTERDKMRVLDGLEGASAQSGATFDRAATERILSGLTARTFLCNNVHDDAPVLLRSRFVLSYLRGPLTRAQIAALMGVRKAAAAVAAPSRDMGAAAVAASAKTASPSVGSPSSRPLLPGGITERFAVARTQPAASESLIYRPALLGTARVHFVSTKEGVDLWRDLSVIAPLAAEVDEDPWDEPDVASTTRMPRLSDEPSPAAGFDALPPGASQAKSFAAWTKRLAEALYRDQRVTVHRCKAVDATSQPDEDLGAFRSRCAQIARESRDRAVEELRRRYAPKLSALQDKLRRSEERVDRERSQARQQTTQTAISIGATILGALFGRKTVSASNLGRATTALRGASRVGREREDVARAEESVESVRAQIDELQAQFDRDSEGVKASFEAEALPIDTVEITPRKSDVAVLGVGILWVPWARDARGALTALVDPFAAPRT